MRLSRVLDALRFHPWNTGGGLEPAGWLNATRRAAYPMSQAARRTTRRGGRQAKGDAKRELEREPSLPQPHADPL